jgi:hypothetical protein
MAKITNHINFKVVSDPAVSLWDESEVEDGQPPPQLWQGKKLNPFALFASLKN